MAAPKDRGIVLSPAQQRSRRARNIAIGLIIGLLVMIVYALTIAKLGGRVGDRVL